MLVRHVGSSRTPVDGHLAALAGERLICSEFQYRHQTEIFGEGEPADYVYQMIRGSVRTYKLLSDGRRQINAFHLPGDLFGLENGEAHRFTAEAITDTTVRIAKRRSLYGELEQRRSSGLTNNLLGLVTKNLQHAEDHMMLLGRKTAAERVAAFLGRNGPAYGGSKYYDFADDPSRHCRLSRSNVGDRIARAICTARSKSNSLYVPQTAGAYTS